MIDCEQRVTRELFAGRGYREIEGESRRHGCVSHTRRQEKVARGGGRRPPASEFGCELLALW